MKDQLPILSNDLLPDYLEKVSNGLKEAFDALEDAEISTDAFSFYTSVASVFSSKIEGEAIELDSYIKHKKFGIEFSPDYTKKIDDLYEAYTFAKNHALNEGNIRKVHALLSKNMLTKNKQGKYRTQNMYVSTPDGRIAYVAASLVDVESEMKKFYTDLAFLLERKMTFAEAFFFASMIHLVFVKIHPWNDGNGRSARLIEKWFIAQKLGEKAWFLQSEKMYYQQQQNYYANIRNLGLEYPSLEYKKALPLLLMLPSAFL
jgi:Fic family protein